MKILAVIVLVAILIGAALQYLNHDGRPPPPDKDSGWTQR